MNVDESTRRPKDTETPEAAAQADDFPSGTPPADGRQAAIDLEETEGQPGDGARAPASEQIAQLKRECELLRDQALRARADFVNYQKRARQQADAERSYAVGPLARDLLDPIDNLERAIEALRASGASGVTAGLDMVQKQLVEILAKHGVKPIPARGHPFDPNLHDAVAQEPSLEYPEGTVVAELGKGYTIADRVLRPSKVAVSVRPPSP
jgi:molecular chaperone GrpE